MTTLFHFKDHQTGVDHHWSQAIQDLKSAVHASGAESWTAYLTTQIDVSMAWALWGAFLGELSRTGFFVSHTAVVHLEWLMAQSQNWNVAGGVSVKVCDSSCTLSSVWGMPNNNVVFQELNVCQLSGSVLYHSRRYAWISITGQFFNEIKTLLFLHILWLTHCRTIISSVSDLAVMKSWTSVRCRLWQYYVYRQALSCEFRSLQ